MIHFLSPWTGKPACLGWPAREHGATIEVHEVTCPGCRASELVRCLELVLGLRKPEGHEMVLTAWVKLARLRLEAASASGRAS